MALCLVSGWDFKGLLYLALDSRQTRLRLLFPGVWQLPNGLVDTVSAQPTKDTISTAGVTWEVFPSLNGNLVTLSAA